MNEVLIEEDKQQIEKNSIEKYNSLCQKIEFTGKSQLCE